MPKFFLSKFSLINFLKQSIVIAFAVFFCLRPVSVLAATTKILPDGAKQRNQIAFELVKYDLFMNVAKNHTYNIIERITINMPETLNQISVELPNTNTIISNISVDEYNCEIETKGIHRTAVITGLGKLEPGEHTFVLKFNVKELKDINADKDIFYYDALTPDWRQPIGELKIYAEFPEDFPWTDIQYYAGQFGIKSEDTKLSYQNNSSNKTITITGNKIPENFAVSLKASLPDGYWEGSLDGSLLGNIAIIVLASTCLLLFLLWLIGGKDPKFARIAVTHPVQNITPVETGIVMNGRMNVRDIVAFILYLAIKGYVKISEYHPKKYRLIKLADPRSEERYIRNGFNLLFDEAEYNMLDMHEFRMRFGLLMQTMKLDIESGFNKSQLSWRTPLSVRLRFFGIIMLSLALTFVDLTTFMFQNIRMSYIEIISVFIVSLASLYITARTYDRFYENESRYNRVRLFGQITIVLAIVLFVSYQALVRGKNPLLSITVLLAAALCVFLILIMRARGSGNAELVNIFLGMRNFVENCEYAQINKFQFDDSNYFYSMLPYVYLFSDLEHWGKSFENIRINPPYFFSDDVSWHTSKSNTMKSALDYARDIKIFARTIENELSNKSTKWRPIE